MLDEQYKELYGLIKDAFIEMQALVNAHKENHKYLFSHYDFPRFQHIKENGMPSFITSFFTAGPPDYSSLFRSNDKDEHYYCYETISSFQKLLSFFENNTSELKKHPYFSRLDFDNPYMRSLLASKLLECFDCYMHEANSDEFCENSFNNVVLKQFAQFFNSSLSISICIPILLVRFESDNEVVSDNICIRKLTEHEMVSSYRVGGYSDTYEVLVVSSATHILELQNYSLNNIPMYAPSALDYADTYPVEMIDKWFAAFRIITHCETGYGQILSFPVDWGIRKGALLDIQGAKIQKYPNSFVTTRKDTDPTPLITKEALQKVNQLFCFFLGNTANSLNIAIKRLNIAYLRESEEDSIIDLMIGIEALVTKDDYGEITYKVSSRTALILSTISCYPYSITETVDAMKKLYKFRSKVVHGETITEKLRTVQLREDISIASVDLARNILENLILAMVEHPDFLVPNNIDPFFWNSYVTMLEQQQKDQ